MGYTIICIFDFQEKKEKAMWTPGATEIIIILIIALLLFGPKKIPQIGAGLGRGILNFKNALKGKNIEEENEEAQSSNNK